MVRDTSLIFLRSLQQAGRRPIVAAGFPALIPVLVLVLVSQLYGGLTRVPGFPAGSYAAWIAPGAFLMPAMFGAGYSPAGLVRDYESGYLDRLRLLPIHPLALLLGRLSFDVVRILVAGLAVLMVSLMLGAELVTGPVGLAAMLLLLALWTLGYVGMYYVVGLTTRSAETLMALIPLFLPVGLLSTVFVPEALMPAWIRAVVRVNPLTYVSEGVRMLMTGPFTWTGMALAVVAAGGLVVVNLALALRAFRGLVRQD